MSALCTHYGKNDRTIDSCYKEHREFSSHYGIVNNCSKENTVKECMQRQGRLNF